MATAGQTVLRGRQKTIPTTMLAAVYRGVDDVRMETVPVPAIGPGELLVRVHTSGICGRRSTSSANRTLSSASALAAPTAAKPPRTANSPTRAWRRADKPLANRSLPLSPSLGAFSPGLFA